MATGYTSKIADGIDFRTFAMDCARAFGACIELRDEPFGGDLIPDEFQPSDYHLKATKSARESLESIRDMTDAECEAAALKDYEENEEYRLQRLRDIADLRVKYETMLASVDDWEPPTGEHEGMKKFMRDQIVSSIDFDCSTTYYEKPTPKQSGEEWRLASIDTHEKSVRYHEENYEKEVALSKNRSEWVSALRKSLNQ